MLRTPYTSTSLQPVPLERFPQIARNWSNLDLEAPPQIWITADERITETATSLRDGWPEMGIPPNSVVIHQRFQTYFPDQLIEAVTAHEVGHLPNDIDGPMGEFIADENAAKLVGPEPVLHMLDEMGHRYGHHTNTSSHPSYQRRMDNLTASLNL